MTQKKKKKKSQTCGEVRSSYCTYKLQWSQQKVVTTQKLKIVYKDIIKIAVLEDNRSYHLKP